MLTTWESFRLQKSSLISPVEYVSAELSLKAETARLGYSLYRDMFGTNTLPAATLYQNIGSRNSQPWILTLLHDVRRFSIISASSENRMIQWHNRIPCSKTPPPPSKYLVNLIGNPNVVCLPLSLTHQCENGCSEYATLKRSKFHWMNLNTGIEWETLKRVSGLSALCC
jgi:hypothetical protein